MTHRVTALIVQLHVISWLKCQTTESASALTTSQTHMYRLLEDLFSNGNYNPDARPVLDSKYGTGTVVSIFLRLSSIQGLDERSQILESTIVLEAAWMDAFLSWEPRSYGYINKLIYPQEYVWLPDLVIANSVESQRQLGYDECPVEIRSTGAITWRPIQVVRTSCNIDITFYPFDTQICEITISSLMSTASDIRYLPSMTGINLDNYSPSGSWSLESTNVTVDYVGDDSRPVTRLSFSLTLRRLRAYYILSMLLPVLFLSFTASAVFYLPAEAGEKVGLSITVLLSFAVYMSILSESMPHTSLQVSVLSLYISSLLAVAAIGVVGSIVVLQIHHRPNDREISPGVERLVRKIRSAFKLEKYPARKQRAASNPQVPTMSTESDIDKLQMFINSKTQKVYTKESINIKDKKADDTAINKNGSSLLDRISIQRRSNVVYPGDYPRVAFIVNQEEGLKENGKTCAQEDPKDELTWPNVAETLDRVMFVVMSLFIVLATIILLCCLSLG